MASARLVGSIPGCDWRTHDDRSRRIESESLVADGLQRFIHIKSAVMPERHSFVQRALKRKLENRMEPLPSSSLIRDYQSDADIEGQLQKAIESERSYFDSVKKCRLQGDYDPVDFENLEMCGRFIRTGQPCHQSEEDMYPKISFLDTVSPYIRKGGDNVNAFSSVDRVSFAKCATSTDGGAAVGPYPVIDDVRRSQDQLSPSTVDRVSSRPMPSLSPVVKSHLGKVPARQDPMSQSQWSTSNANQQLMQPRTQGSSASRGQFLDSSRNIPSQHIFHASSFSKVPHLNHRQGQFHRTRVDRSVNNKHSNLSAFYSLGRKAASTLGSPVCVPALNGSRPSVNQLRVSDLSQYDESRLVKNQSTVVRVHGNGPYRSKFITNENRVMRKRRVLDCRTEEAVKSGKFGSLQTLQSFYSKLGSRKAVVSPLKPVLRGRLGSITNCKPMQAARLLQEVQETYGSVKRIDCYSSQETAIDLSLHKRVPHSDEYLPQYSAEYESRCSVPSERLEMHETYMEQLKAFVDRKQVIVNSDELQQFESIGRSRQSPSGVTSWNVADVKQENYVASLDSCAPRRDCATPDFFSRSEVEPSSTQSSHLPLKKRRLLDAQQNASEEVHQASPSPNEKNTASLERQRRRLSAVKCETSNVAAGSELTFTKSPSEGIDEDEDLPLHSAIANGNNDMVDQILNIMCRLGMPVDRYNSYKQTPLHVAVLTDQPAVVRRLLEAGSSPNVVDLEGMTSVHLASSLKSSKCLDSILQHSGVSLNLGAVAKNGQTALQVAAQRCNLSAVMSLVNAGAYLEPERSRDPTPIAANTVERTELPVQRSMLNYSSTSPAQCLPGQVVLTCRTGVSRHLDLHVPTDVRC